MVARVSPTAANASRYTFLVGSITVVLAVLGGALSTTHAGLAFLALPAAIIFAIWLLTSPETLFLGWLLASPIISNYFAFHLIAGFTPDRLVLFALLVRLGADAIPAQSSLRQPSQPMRLLSGLLILYPLGELVGSLRGPDALTYLIATYADRAFLPVAALLIALIFCLRHGPEYACKVVAMAGWVGVMSVVLELLRSHAGLASLIYPQGEVTWTDVAGTRAAGEFTNPAIFGAVVALSQAAVLFGLWPKNSTWWKRWALSAAFTWAVAVSYTRSAWISFALVIVLFFALGRNKLDRVALLIAMALAATAITVVVPPASLSTFAARFSESQDFVVRGGLNAAMWQQFLAAPLFGSGAGWFDKLHSVLTFSAGGRLVLLPVSHNSIFLMLADRGLVAFIPWILIVGYALFASFNLYRNGSVQTQKIVCVCWAMGIIYLTTANIIQVEFFSYFIDLFWILMGVVIGLWWRSMGIPHATPAASVQRQSASW